MPRWSSWDVRLAAVGAYWRVSANADVSPGARREVGTFTSSVKHIHDLDRGSETKSVVHVRSVFLTGTNKSVACIGLSGSSR